ncbi:hypothetical protein CCP3SC5AM1_2520001 [Gammaproteobacteria bacterium]
MVHCCILTQLFVNCVTPNSNTFATKTGGQTPDNVTETVMRRDAAGQQQELSELFLFFAGEGFHSHPVLNSVQYCTENDYQDVLERV